MGEEDQIANNTGQTTTPSATFDHNNHQYKFCCARFDAKRGALILAIIWILFSIVLIILTSYNTYDQSQSENTNIANASSSIKNALCENQVVTLLGLNCTTNDTTSVHGDKTIYGYSTQDVVIFFGVVYGLLLLGVLVATIIMLVGWKIENAHLLLPLMILQAMGIVIVGLFVLSIVLALSSSSTVVESHVRSGMVGALIGHVLFIIYHAVFFSALMKCFVLFRDKKSWSRRGRVIHVQEAPATAAAQMGIESAGLSGVLPTQHPAELYDASALPPPMIETVDTQKQEQLPVPPGAVFTVDAHQPPENTLPDVVTDQVTPADPAF